LDYGYIEKNLDLIRAKINKAELNRDNKYDKNGKVRLLAVTKTVEAEKINFAISKGVDLIGENRVSELLEKYDKINKDGGLEIHFIGNLQTNKVKHIIDKVNLIQSVDSVRLAEEINKRASQRNIKIDVLIEINIGGEDSKIGINPGEALEFARSLQDFDNLRIKGLMTIPPYFADQKKDGLIKYFDKMHEIFIELSAKKANNINMQVLSMGMSEDYEEAISRGSNIVRIGRAVFGERF